MINNCFALEPLGFIKTPFKQKFAIPRQPRLVPQAIGELTLIAPFDNPDLFRDLEQFSHVWLLFMFHENLEKGWTPTIRPPRLGGNQRTGVLATRSTFRPNGIGMSAVQLLEVNGKTIKVGGIDLLDGTPIVDIKPYIPYSDIIEDANGGFAQNAPENNMEVIFSHEALKQCEQFVSQNPNKYPQLKALIENLLKQDPRPAYRQHKTNIQEYGVAIYDLEVNWQVEGQVTTVQSIKNN